jgi:RNA polymerase sigma-70 factor (ECF subfamily)
LIFREVEDRDLILRAAANDVSAYNLLVSRWEKRIYNYLLRLVGNREDAMDLNQDVFLKAYQSLRKLEDPARFGPWLFRIAHNEAYSLLRKPKTEQASDSSNERLESPAWGQMLPMETSLAVERALSKLTDEQREAVLLKVYQGFKFEEIADILSTPVSTIKSRVYTALEQLKLSLAPIRSSK